MKFFVLIYNQTHTRTALYVPFLFLLQFIPYNILTKKWYIVNVTAQTQQILKS